MDFESSGWEFEPPRGHSLLMTFYVFILSTANFDYKKIILSF